MLRGIGGIPVWIYYPPAAFPVLGGKKASQDELALFRFMVRDDAWDDLLKERETLAGTVLLLFRVLLPDGLQ